MQLDTTLRRNKRTEAYLQSGVHFDSSKWSTNCEARPLLIHYSEVQILSSALCSQTSSISVLCPASEAQLY